MSTVITIPLDGSKEIAEMVADKQPGDRLYACGTIKSLDTQTLTLRIEEVADKPDDLPEPDKADTDDDDDNEDEEDNGSSTSETQEAIDLASPGGYTGP